MAVQSMDMQFHKLKQQFEWSEQQEKNNVKAQAENSEMALQYALGKTSQTAAGLKRVDDKFEAAALDAGAALNSSEGLLEIAQESLDKSMSEREHKLNISNGDMGASVDGIGSETA